MERSEGGRDIRRALRHGELSRPQKRNGKNASFQTTKVACCHGQSTNLFGSLWFWGLFDLAPQYIRPSKIIYSTSWGIKRCPRHNLVLLYRRSLYFHSNILDSLTAWLAGVQLNPVFLFPPSQAVSESTIFEWKYQLLRYASRCATGARLLVSASYLTQPSHNSCEAAYARALLLTWRTGPTNTQELGTAQLQKSFRD